MNRIARAYYNIVNKGGFLRWLFVFRKTYLIRSGKSHFSQWGEDVVVEKFLLHAPKGSYYIDVGCFHPKKHSNTYRLFKSGWRGINIDVDDIKTDVFRLARPEDENICCAVGSNPATAKLYSFGHYSLMNTLDREKADEYVRSGFQCEEKAIAVKTLTDIIDKSRFKAEPIGLLNIDVEGFEESVLRSLDFTRYRPRLILIELHIGTLESLLNDRSYQFLTKDLGYEMVNWTGLTVFFLDRDLATARAVLG